MLIIHRKDNGSIVDFSCDSAKFGNFNSDLEISRVDEFYDESLSYFQTNISEFPSATIITSSIIYSIN